MAVVHLRPLFSRDAGLFQLIRQCKLAILSGAVTLIGVLIANSKSNAVMEYKIEELTREVRKHNGFAEKIPVIQRDIEVANHRIADLEASEHERERNQT